MLASIVAMNALPLDLLHRTLGALSGMFQVQPIEIPDCPVFLAAAMPLTPGVTGERPRLPAGRGLTARQAMTSAAAEAVELKACLARNRKPHRRDGLRRDGLALIAARDLLSGQATPVPAQDVFLDYAAVFGEPLVNDADSTGCAAAATQKEAEHAALLECVERDAASIWWYGRKSYPHLTPDLLDRAAPRLAWWLSGRRRQTRLIDITSNVGIPVVAAVSAEPAGDRVAIGMAANLDIPAAAVSAATEMVQTEVSIRMGEKAGDAELDAWLAQASMSAMPQFAPAERDKARNRETRQDELALVAAAGFRPLGVDLSLPGDPLRVARVLVPGFCALRRRFVTERILAHPGGARSAEEFETLELF